MILLYSSLGLIFAAVVAMTVVVLYRPPAWLLDATGAEINHERIKSAILILAAGIGALWAFYLFVTSGQLIAYEFKKLHDNPTLVISFEVEEHLFEGATYLVVMVNAKNEGKKFAKVKYNDIELLTIGKLKTDANGRFTFKSSKEQSEASDTIPVPVYDKFYHPPSVRLHSGSSSTWVQGAIDPGATETYSFIQRVDGPGIYHIQFKAKLSDELAWRRDKEIHDAPERSVFSAGSIYHIVGSQLVEH